MVSAQSAHSHLKLARSATNDQPDAFNNSSADRRAHRRLTVSELSWLKHARIKYGPDISLIDLSAGGVQIETTSPVLPANTVVIEFVAGEQTWPVPARVLRCHVRALTPHVTYRGGLMFKRPFDFQEVAQVVESGIDVNPIHEYARLNVALNRVTEMSSMGLTPLSATGTRALKAAFAMIEAARGRDAAAPFTKEMGRLLRVLATAVENPADAGSVVPEIISRLRRSVPSLMVRMVDAGHAPLICTDAVFFRVPTEGVETPARLVIEFPRDCPLEAWHLQLLEAAAHLITVTRDLTSSRDGSTGVEPAPEITSAPEAAEPRGWNRLVVRYRDGRLLKGWGRDLLPARGSLDLWNEPDGPSESRITIPFAHLKAVFFVHDFEGNPAHSVSEDAEDPSLRGRRITVTFVDGEVLRGVTLGYSQNAPGFFVSPLDGTTNNAKIFVLTGAIRHVQFHDVSNRTSAPQPALSLAR
jgi:hypothetical protein